MVITVAVTGASGSIYAKSLINKLLDHSQVELIYLIFTDSGRSVSEFEEPSLLDFSSEASLDSRIKVVSNSDFYTPIASGSGAADAMVIIPCSMGTLGRIAGGVSLDLVGRAADVMLKQDKTLVLCTRESPLSIIHLRNMCTVREAGGIIAPLSPSFYNKPLTILELADATVDRILSLINLPNKKAFMWQEK